MIALEEGVFVSPQIGSEGVAAAAAAGVRTIVNNRPDGEEPGQPGSAEIEAAAAAAGLAYRHIPVAGAFPADKVAAMVDALRKGPVLAFCKSGTRSTYIWALARAADGAQVEELVGKAAAAGYDLRPLLPLLR
ncbi:MAG TPA: TIGR01244 family sulfur transferase [Allosphingosinicella sp.]|nr:TIGR01244 family sulfur transferase [Allosphingosinicella sp.]